MRETRLSDNLLAAINSKEPVCGYTHNFYRYPARFSPVFAQEVIRLYSGPGDIVFDPFMGGGTTIVEALALGRKAIGVDLNALAQFVATVKTTPLSRNDIAVLEDWTNDIRRPLLSGGSASSSPVRNLPLHVHNVCAALMTRLESLPLNRERSFARCALLRTGQWAVDCKKRIPTPQEIVAKFQAHMEGMLEDIFAFTDGCQLHGMPKTCIRRSRLLLCRSTVGLECDARLKPWQKPKLVLTSPPYPSVHILYHRWQVDGRKETPAPYWLAALNDGHPESHYTFGSRSPLGLQNYFRTIEKSFRSIRQIVADNALVVQLVAFSDATSHLPRYLAAMEQAGFAETDALSVSDEARVWRSVPNRKWYCHNGRDQDSAKEVLLFHQPA